MKPVRIVDDIAVTTQAPQKAIIKMQIKILKKLLIVTKLQESTIKLKIKYKMVV